jgi:Holliday junction resolvasome RuvABC DNA-binding subunit
VHEGRLIIEGRPSMGLVFKHADGTPYGGTLDSSAADRNAQVFAGLRTMGFKERDCREAVDRCSKNLAATATREEMLRAALGMLTS